MRKWRRVGQWAVPLGALWVLTGGTSVPQVQFTDVTQAVGIDFKHENSATSNKYLIETMGGGVALFDYDNDGRLDLCVFSPRTLRDTVRVAWRLMRKDFRSDPCMLHVSGTRFRVETMPPRAAQADGEMIGDTPFEARVEPRAATLLLPRGD